MAFVLWLIHPDYLGAFYLYIIANEHMFERHKDTFLTTMHRQIIKVTDISNRLLEKLLQQSCAGKGGDRGSKNTSSATTNQ